MYRITFLAVVLATVSSFSLAQEPAKTQASTGPSQITVGGAVKTPFTVTAEDLKKMPRKTVSVENTHAQKTEVYEGVPLETLLQKAGVPHGAQIRGAETLTTYVMVEAADDYRVIFSLAELDSGFQDSEVLVADTMDGAPLPGELGPFRLVVPHDKRPARWMRMVKSVTVGHVGS
jgi:DMSO/TMAO reductase YedYZ molybdopterin-dependent catalytic subunit